MLTCMSTSRSNYTDMSIWKKHADHSTSKDCTRDCIYVETNLIWPTLCNEMTIIDEQVMFGPTRSSNVWWNKMHTYRNHKSPWLVVNIWDLLTLLPKYYATESRSQILVTDKDALWDVGKRSIRFWASCDSVKEYNFLLVHVAYNWCLVYLMFKPLIRPYIKDWSRRLKK